MLASLKFAEQASRLDTQMGVEDAVVSPRAGNSGRVSLLPPGLSSGDLSFCFCFFLKAFD